VEMFARSFEDEAGRRFVLMIDDLYLPVVTSATVVRQLLVTGLLMGKAPYELGSFFEADVDWSRPGRLAGGDEQGVAVAGARAPNLVPGMVRPDDAVAVNQAALAASEPA
jgi:hypothetical protein